MSWKASDAIVASVCSVRTKMLQRCCCTPIAHHHWACRIKVIVFLPHYFVGLWCFPWVWPSLVLLVDATNCVLEVALSLPTSEGVNVQGITYFPVIVSTLRISGCAAACIHFLLFCKHIRLITSWLCWCVANTFLITCRCDACTANQKSFSFLAHFI